MCRAELHGPHHLGDHKAGETQDRQPCVMKRTQAQSHEKERESFLTCVLALETWASYPCLHFFICKRGARMRVCHEN